MSSYLPYSPRIVTSKAGAFARAEMKPLLDELSIREEELQPVPIEAFQTPGVPEDVQRMRFERYETKRKEKLRLLQQALGDRRKSVRNITATAAAAEDPAQSSKECSRSLSGSRYQGIRLFGQK